MIHPDPQRIQKPSAISARPQHLFPQQRRRLRMVQPAHSPPLEIAGAKQPQRSSSPRSAVGASWGERSVHVQQGILEVVHLNDKGTATSLKLRPPDSNWPKQPVKKLDESTVKHIHKTHVWLPTPATLKSDKIQDSFFSTTPAIVCMPTFLGGICVASFLHVFPPVFCWILKLPFLWEASCLKQTRNPTKSR